MDKKFCRRKTKKCVYKNIHGRLSPFSTVKVDKSRLSTWEKEKRWINVDKVNNTDLHFPAIYGGKPEKAGFSVDKSGIRTNFWNKFSPSLLWINRKKRVSFRKKA